MCERAGFVRAMMSVGSTSLQSIDAAGCAFKVFDGRAYVCGKARSACGSCLRSLLPPIFLGMESKVKIRGQRRPLALLRHDSARSAAASGEWGGKVLAVAAQHRKDGAWRRAVLWCRALAILRCRAFDG
ncbi:hypothetical protein FHS19_003952 [Paenibacillus rhizosphaerae]|uniref:Uncharacterized protein n=1 Tax=Paenibacillus rhizosphaerae TaxID=297318 RepID=A0A839TX92_9BACL|nr:hypothetical protein [Paenibacillus rhizosphaerae]MBB3129277.1 hypothetical protein [Paenibacillus rhizosphaerae]